MNAIEIYLKQIDQVWVLEWGKDLPYTWDTLPEEVCKKLCYEHDKGKQWSPSSRYTYSIADNKYTPKKKGYIIPFGTAKAVIQYILINYTTRQVGDTLNLYQEKV